MGGRNMARCVVCKTMRYESDLKYDSTIKDFVCKIQEKCETARNQKPSEVYKMRWGRI